jgi:hypothetical protein
MYTINVKTELLPLLGIIDLPCGKLVKTIMMRRKKKVPVVPVPDRPYFFLPPLLFSAAPTVRRATLFSPGGCRLLIQRAKMVSQGCKLLSDIGQCPTKFGKCPSKSNFDRTLVRSQKKIVTYFFLL